MDLTTHQRLLSIFHIIYGSLALLILVGVRFIFALFVTPIFESGEFDGLNDGIKTLIAGMAEVIVIVLILVIAIPSIIGGIATLQRKSWGFILMMISGCLSLLSFPIGTVLGVYTIWNFVEKSNQQNVTNQ